MFSTGQDRLPEYCQYQDEGCDLAPSCLRCPFPACVYEQPRGRQRRLKALRNQELIRLHARGKSAGELARLFGVSQRTVQRAVKGGLPDV